MSWCDEYLREVAAQIRVRRVRETLTAELRDHLEAQRESYIMSGLDASEAERRAILDMGDPLLVGGELDAVHRPRTPWRGLMAALGLMLLGFILRYWTAGRPADPSILAFLLSAGLLALFGCTDYTGWLKTAIPLGAGWLAFAAYRLLFILVPTGIPWHSPLELLYYLLVPQVLAVAMPLLLAMLAARLRGRGAGAFIACLSLPASLLALAFAYRHTGFDPGPMSVMALLGFGVLALAVKEGFFRLHRRRACLALAALAMLALAAFLYLLVRDLSLEQPHWNDVLYPLVRHARLLGRSAGFALLNESDAAIFVGAEAFNYAFLAGVVALCGWLPFMALALIVVGIFAGLFRRFIPMENRMGRLIGLAGAATLAVQVVLHFLYCFAHGTQQLCIPLLSQGSVMLLADAAIVGALLSVLRGANLPEAALTVSDRAPGTSQFFSQV